MKKFLKSIVLFIPFSILMYTIVIIIIDNYMPIQLLKPNINYIKGAYGHMYSRINEIADYRDIDILFLGSSHTYRGFDVRVFKEHNLRCFNLGSSGQTPIQTEVLLKRYLKILNPKLIIFEVSPMNFTSVGIESSLDVISNDKNDLLTITKLINWRNIKTINTALVGFYQDFINVDKKFIEQKERANDKYISGGFVEKKVKFNILTKSNDKKILLIDTQIKAFDNIIKSVNSQGIKILFVRAPITKELNKSYTNIDYFEGFISKRGIYYDFNNLLELDDSIHFYDFHHLNQIGVKIFNEKLIEVLNLDSDK